MKIAKKFFLILVVLAVMTLAVFELTTCKIGGSKGGETNVLTVGVTDTEAEVGVMNQIISSFKSQYPTALSDAGIDDIELVRLSTNDYDTKIKGMAKTGTLPDLFMNMDTLVANFAKGGVTLNLSSYVNQNLEYSKAVGDMYPAMYQQGIFKTTQGEELHMLAREYSRTVIYYNKTMFAAKGISEPAVTWTWDDFVNIARQFVDYDTASSTWNVAGANLQFTWPNYTLSMICGLGGNLFDALGNASVTEATAQALSVIKQLNEEHVIVNNHGGTADNLDFTRQNIAMAAGTRADIVNYLSVFKGSNKCDWGVLPYPDTSRYNGNSAYIGTGTSGYSVYALSKNKDIAVKFLMHIISEEGQKALASTGAYVPVRQSLKFHTCWRNGLNIKDFPTNFNHDAFIYNTEKDLMPFSTMVKDATKQKELNDKMSNMISSYLVSGLNGQTASEWATFWTNSLNEVFSN